MELNELNNSKPSEPILQDRPSPTSKQTLFSASFLSKINFTWIYPTIKLANSKNLQTDEIHDLPHRESAEHQSLPYSPGMLLRNLLSTFRYEILIVCLFNLIDAIILFAGPVYIIFLEDYFTSDMEMYYGMMSLGILAVVYIISTLIGSQYCWRYILLQLHLRVAISNLLYSKTLKLTTSASAGQTVNILQVDCNRIAECARWLGPLLISPIQLVLAILLLFKYAKWAAGVGLIVLMLFILVNFCLTKWNKNINDLLMTLRDERMKRTNELFSHIKMLKIYCFEGLFMKSALEARDQEVKELYKSMTISAFQIFSSWGGPVVTSIAVFLCYEPLNGEPLDALAAFTTLSVLNILKDALRQCPYALATCIQAYVSIQRIDEFLQLQEIEHKAETNTKGAVTFENATFCHGDVSILRNINLNIKPGEFVAIVGPVGSGKSSILNAILGEMHLKCGSLKVGGSLAYTASLETWIQNASLRDNITFYNTPNEMRYSKVLKACALIPDIAALPGGDRTEIGEKGINLSGGQKARIGLARAVYSDRDIYLLDDPLASVDNHVAKHLFHKCFLEALSGKTRILVTHSTHFLHLVDRIIVMKEGSIDQVGSIQDIKLAQPAIDSDHTDTRTEISTENTQLIEEEDKEAGRVKMSIYLEYFKYCGGVILCISALIAMFMWQGLKIGSDISLKNWGDSSDTSKFVNYYLFMGLASIVFILIRCLIVLVGGVRGAYRLYEDMIKALVRAPINLFYDITPLGRVLNRLSKDQNEIDSQVPFCFGGLLAMVYSFMGEIVMCVIFVPWILVVTPLLFHLGYRIQTVYITGARELSRLEHISKSPIVNNFTETMSGIKTIRAFNSTINFQERNNRFLNDNTKICFNIGGMAVWLGTWMSYGANILTLMVIFLLILGKESLTAGVAGLCVTYLIPLSDHVVYLIQDISNLENTMVAVERAISYTKTVQEAAETTLKDVTLKNWPSVGKIQFQNVHMKYRPNTSLVLQGLSFEISGGEKIGIVGRTGSGKSSITMTLLRIIELHKGKILIDDVDISTIGLKKLRKSITLIPQDPVLFRGSLKFNLDPFETATHSEVKQLLERVGLGSLDIYGEVNEGGTNYSVGERQLICIARAAINDTKILMLDEATAAIDLQTHERIQEFLKYRFGSITTLVIAHRLDTVMECNRVMVLEQGKTLEFAAPKVLLQNSKSEFSKLARHLGHIKN